MEVEESSIAEFVMNMFDQQYNDRRWYVYDCLPVCVDVIDTMGRFHYMNARCADFYGFNEHESNEITVSDIAVNQRQAGELLKHLKWVANDRPELVPYIGLKKALKGNIFYVRIDWDYIVYQDKVLGFVSVITDLSHKMPDIMRYRANELVVSSMIQTLLCGVMIISSNGTILEVNRIGERIMLQKRADLLGSHFMDLLTSANTSSEDLWLNFEWSKYARMNEYKLANKDGGSHYILIESASAITYKSISSLLVFVKDITNERLKADELALNKRALEKSYRNNIFKEMISGVAHEMNQPLSAIANYATGCVRRLQGENIDPEIVKVLNMIAMQSSRASNIIDNLKSLSVGYGELFEKVDVKNIINDSIKIIEFDLSHAAIKLKHKYSRVPMFIDACAIELEQVMVNLIRNAIDALMLHEGGDIIRRLFIQVEAGQSCEVVIQISDNALVGIDENTARHLFEPFYTTKENGMGMGLALCENIILDHGGHISYKKGEAGYTTTFEIVLPLCQSLKNKKLT